MMGLGQVALGMILMLIVVAYLMGWLQSIYTTLQNMAAFFNGLGKGLSSLMILVRS
jgi:hypothetical protein